MTAFDTAWDLLKMPYHGTNNEAAKKIMIEGLKPHFNENSARMGIPEVVFATDNYEEALAHAEDDTYGTDLNPVVIHISDEVKPADDSYAPWYLYDKIIPPDKLRIMQKSFDTAWDLLKSEYLYYNVQVQPKDGEQEKRLSDLEYQLASEGISYDRGWGSQGRDIHLDFSLSGATPEQVLQRIKSIDVPFEVEMTAGNIPYHGTDARHEYDRNEKNALDERLTMETGQTHVDGKPYSEPEVIGHHPCPSCKEPGGVLIREGVQHDNKISLNCPECGHLDMDWGENNDRL